MGKHTLEEIKEFAESKGYEVLDETYINMKTKMHFKCKKCNHIVEKTFDTFKYHNICSNCTKKENEIKNKSTRVKFTLEVIENFLNEHDIELIETKLDKGVKSWMTLRCKKCDHKFKRVFYNFRKNPTCPKCRDNPRAMPYEEIKNFIEVESKSGCKIITTKEEYKQKRIEQPKMALCKIDIQCKCGNKFSESFNTFKSSNVRRCRKCSDKANGKARKHTYEDVKKYIEIDSNSGCKLLSKTYEDYHKPLHLQCSCGNDFYRALAEFKGRKLFKCKLCTGATIQYTYDQIYDDLKEHNIKLLSTEYISCKENIDVEYNCGFKVSRNYDNIRRSNYECPHCRKEGYGRDTEQFKQEVYDVTNGEYTLLSEYKTMNDKVLMKHNTCGIEWEITPHNFLDGGTRCPVCTISRGEYCINRYLTNNNIKFIPQYEFEGLLGLGGGLLKYDFATFDNKNKLNYLIEYDGEFHYFPIMGEEQLKKQKEHDKRKNKYCEKHNIRLIRIPYWEFDNIENILKDILINNNLNNKFIFV